MQHRTLALSVAVVAGFSALGLLSMTSLMAEPLPTPTPQPLPTRRPTPQPQVTPAPMKIAQAAASGTLLRFDGIVAGTPGKVDFFFRTNNQVYRVVPWNPDLLRQIRGGDGVRVFGLVDGLMITRANVRTTRSRASSSPDDYDERSIGNITHTQGTGRR